jgi:hypothetical protein
VVDHHIVGVHQLDAEPIVVGDVVARAVGRAVRSRADVEIGGVDRIDPVTGVRGADVARGLELAVVDRDVRGPVEVDPGPVALVVGNPVDRDVR